MMPLTTTEEGEEIARLQSDIATLEQEARQMRARMERLQGIADAAKNLIAQKGRHNTEIAYRRLEEAVKKGE